MKTKQVRLYWALIYVVGLSWTYSTHGYFWLFTFSFNAEISFRSEWSSSLLWLALVEWLAWVSFGNDFVGVAAPGDRICTTGGIKGIRGFFLFGRNTSRDVSEACSELARIGFLLSSSCSLLLLSSSSSSSDSGMDLKLDFLETFREWDSS